MFAQGLEAQRLERFGDVPAAWETARERGLAGDVRLEDLPGIAPEQPLTGQELEEDDAERVHVAPRVDRAAQRLLRRHVRGRADESAR